MAPTDSFRDIYSACFRDITRYAVVRCRTLSDVEDLVQDTFLALYRQLAAGKNIRDPRAYLYRVCDRELARRYQANQREARNVPLFSEADGFPEEELEASQEMPAFASAAEKRELLLRVFDDITAMPPETAKCFTLFYMYDMPLRQIAAALGLSESDVKNRIYRSRKKLRERYSREEI